MKMKTEVKIHCCCYYHARENKYCNLNVKLLIITLYNYSRHRQSSEHWTTGSRSIAAAATAKRGKIWTPKKLLVLLFSDWSRKCWASLTNLKAMLSKERDTIGVNWKFLGMITSKSFYFYNIFFLGIDSKVWDKKVWNFVFYSLQTIIVVLTCKW